MSSCAGGGCADAAAGVGHVSLRPESRQGPGRGQGPRQRPFSTVFTSSVSPRCHQRRLSADFCKGGTSSAIAVRKNRQEPQPHQRSEPSLRSPAASHPPFKRLSCPPVGAPRSSSSSSSSSSCSSPPPVPTSAITGPDPLGWRLRPKSASASSRPRGSRLSLQIPLPVVFPDPSPQPVDAPNLDPSRGAAPLPRPKPSRRRHSDSSAFAGSPAAPVAPLLPIVTLEELSAVHLRSLSLSHEADDVFGEGGKKPPPVPEKTATAQLIARVISQSRRCGQPAPARGNGEDIYASVLKPKHKDSHQGEEHSSLRVRKTAGLRVDASCDRERPMPRFPG